MREYNIPSNFEESGRLLGIFEIRNVIEAGIVSIPIIYLVFTLVPLILTWKIIISSAFVIPLGGIALIGINDDPLSIFTLSFYHWFRNRRIIEYRGEIKR